VFYTLIETAKLNGLDPEACIAAIINRMATSHVSKRLDALLPWNFKTEEAKALDRGRWTDVELRDSTVGRIPS
jgi:transposase